MLIIDKKSNKNKVFKLFSRKAKEHTENTEIKVNIDIFYELFRLARLHLKRAMCLLLSVFFLVSFTLFSFSGSQEVIDRIAAVVNEYVITLSDVKITESFDLFDAKEDSQEKNFLWNLDRLINQKMVIGFNQESIPVEPEDVEAAYQSLLIKLGNDTIKTKLELFGLQKEDLHTYLYETILFQRIVENRFGLSVRVSLRDIEEFYRENYVPAQKIKDIEPLSMMDALEEIESAIKRDKISLLVGEWLNRLRSEADIQIFLKEEML